LTRNCEECVDTDELEVIESAQMRMNEPLAEGDGEAGDGDDDEEGHLETGLEEGPWIEDEDAEGGGAESV
jgi:hypothetical protein